MQQFPSILVKRPHSIHVFFREELCVKKYGHLRMRQRKNAERDVATTSVPQSPGFESWAYRPITSS